MTHIAEVLVDLLRGLDIEPDDETIERAERERLERARENEDDAPATPEL